MLITAAESRRKTPTVMYSAGSVSTPITAGGASMESQSPQNKMARWNSCLKQIVTTRLFGLGIAIIVLPLSAIKNQKPCKLSLKTEAKSVLKANKYSQITMQNGEL